MQWIAPDQIEFPFHAIPWLSFIERSSVKLDDASHRMRRVGWISYRTLDSLLNGQVDDLCRALDGFCGPLCMGDVNLRLLAQYLHVQEVNPSRQTCPRQERNVC